MSRSQRNRKEKNGVFISYVCYESNKKDKEFANRKFRRKSKVDIHELDKDLAYSTREVSDTYLFSSDGLVWYESFDSNYFQDEESKGRHKEWLKSQKRK